MRVSSRVKIALAVWVVAEALVFLALVKLVGVGGTFLIGLATSALGFMLLKRTGVAAMVKLRSSFQGRISRSSGDVVDSALATLGALALLLPGFLSDLLGLVLLVPPLRRRITGWLTAGGVSALRRGSGTRGRRGPRVVDLEPEEWRPTDGRSATKLTP